MKIVASYLIHLPLNRLVEKDSSALTRVISAVAIAVLTCLSLSLYGFYACHFYINYFAHRKVQDVEEQLHTAVDQQDLAAVQQLFINYPYLQKRINPSADFPENFEIARSPLANAIVNGDKAIVEFFIKNGADLNDQTFRGIPLEVLLSNWERNDHNERMKMLQLLLNSGAALILDHLCLFVRFLGYSKKPWTSETFEIAKFLIQHVDCNTKEMEHSHLYYAFQFLWPKGQGTENAYVLRDFFDFMYAKGARFRESEIKELANPQSEALRELHPQAIEYIHKVFLD